MDGGYIHGDRQDFIEPAQNFFQANVKGPFRLPGFFFRLRDRIQIYLATKFFAFSIFAPHLRIENHYGFSIYWSIIIAYLKKNGVLDTINYRYRKDGYPPMHTFRAETSSIKDEQKIHSASAHTNSEIALIKCIGELLERRTLAIPTRAEEESMLITSVDALINEGADFANTFTYNRFLATQTEHKPNLQFDTTKPIRWVTGQNISKKRGALLPAQTTFWFYRHSIQRTEGMLHESNTSGCAGYTTKAGAIVRGLKELIQRDGFLCYWLTHTSPRTIELETISDSAAQALLDEFKKYKFDIHLLDITTNIGLPSIAVVAIDRATQRPRMHLTAAAHTDPLTAIVDGLLEMHSLLGCFDGGNEIEMPADFKPFVTPFGRHERIRHMHGEEILKRVEWFWQGQTISFSEFNAKFPIVAYDDTTALKHVLELLKQRGDGYDAYIYEARSPILKALGYHAVRTCIPKLIPLYLGENNATLDSDRLYEFAALNNKQYSPKELLLGHIPPHPFP